MRGGGRHFSCSTRLHATRRACARTVRDFHSRVRTVRQRVGLVGVLDASPTMWSGKREAPDYLQFPPQLPTGGSLARCVLGVTVELLIHRLLRPVVTAAVWFAFRNLSLAW